MGHGQHSWHGAGCVPQQAGRAPLASRTPARALQAHNLQYWGSLPYKGGMNSPIKVCTALLRGDANYSPTHAGLTTYVCTEGFKTFNLTSSEQDRELRVPDSALLHFLSQPCKAHGCCRVQSPVLQLPNGPGCSGRECLPKISD